MKLKKSEMEINVTYIICPDKSKRCRLFLNTNDNTKDYYRCERHCPQKDKLKLIIICDNCKEMIILPGDHDSWCRIEHQCSSGPGLAFNFRMDNRHYLLYKIPKK